MKNQSNYVKLTAYGPASLHDSEAVSSAPRDTDVECVVSWVFPFTTRGEAASALIAAQAKRMEKRSVFQDARYELSTWKPSTLRGVPVVGVPMRELPAEDDDAFEDAGGLAS